DRDRRAGRPRLDRPPRHAVPSLPARARLTAAMVTSRNPIKDAIAFAGVGTTGFRPEGGEMSAAALALPACTAPLRDAGLRPDAAVEGGPGGVLRLGQPVPARPPEGEP